MELQCVRRVRYVFSESLMGRRAVTSEETNHGHHHRHRHRHHHHKHNHDQNDSVATPMPMFNKSYITQPLPDRGDSLSTKPAWTWLRTQTQNPDRKPHAKLRILCAVLRPNQQLQGLLIFIPGLPSSHFHRYPSTRKLV
ncbi:hypothetical protein K505DRAFT_137963 [Melanomma pulvis-pyrius CBS 109.77]|uniref:Uncharacterized protein n=1 Tax=Melanomma pulvis-pyrius CBS 109.77 TaxID=1314802 RepID=A0A6A6WSP5_9PLEO|nr:hypothetical protein K505DRAFT_137963 [Melanomma pulvis-pyrius CBS 109.77]